MDENIGNYYELHKESGTVDDVTWNDLSMDTIFEKINHCKSSMGEEVLYDRLHRTDIGTGQLDELEKKIQFFQEQQEQKEGVGKLLKKIGRNHASYYIPTYMDCMEEFTIKGYGIFRFLQILLLVGILVALLFRTSWALGIFLVIVGINFTVYTLVKSKYEVEMKMLGTVVSLIQVGNTIGKNEEFQKINELQPNIAVVAGELQDVAKKVGKVLALKNVAYYDALGILQDYLTGATMWQMITYCKVMKKLENRTQQYMELYQMIGELDMAMSIAEFRQGQPHYCVPKYCQEKKIEMEDLYHPLLEDPITNSLKLNRNCIITGSNASGKSTFIKAVSSNVILAQTIHTCMATKMKLPRAQMITSMAVRDDIMSGESYFIKEIRYLKRILDHLAEGEIVICAIDEILRGTNTRERILASKAILNYLADKNCIALVASHDKELTELLADQYDNYHFSEEIGEHDIVFSYKIEAGPSTSQNAIKLLEFVGFPKEIIQEAAQ